MRPARSKGPHLSDHRADTRSPGEALKLPFGPRPLRPRRTVGLGHQEASNRSRETDETGDGAASRPPKGGRLARPAGGSLFVSPSSLPSRPSPPAAPFSLPSCLVSCVLLAIIMTRLGFLLCSGLLASASAQSPDAQGPGLHSLAVAAGKLFFGTATDTNLFNDTTYMRMVNNGNEFGVLVPENSQKWEPTEPQQNDFVYTNPDQEQTKTETNKQRFRCHTLTWFQQLPTFGKLFRTHTHTLSLSLSLSLFLSLSFSLL